MTTDLAPPAPPPPAAGPASALLFVLGILPLYVVGMLAQAAHPVFGLAWTELFALLLPAFVAAEGANLASGAYLRLRWPGVRPVALGLVAGLAAYPLASGVMLAATRVLPEDLVKALDVSQLFELPGWQPAGIAVAAVVLAPLCEEVAFRGYLLSTLAARRSAPVAIVISALVFAALHDPVRYAPTFALGLVFGWLAWRAGSVWPAVAAHAANNGVAVAIGFTVTTPGNVEPAPFAAIAFLVTLGAGLLGVAFGLVRALTPPPPPPADALEPRDPGAPSGRFHLARVPLELLVAGALAFAALAAIVAHHDLTGGDGRAPAPVTVPAPPPPGRPAPP